MCRGPLCSLKTMAVWVLGMLMVAMGFQGTGLLFKRDKDMDQVQEERAGEQGLNSTRKTTRGGELVFSPSSVRVFEPEQLGGALGGSPDPSRRVVGNISGWLPHHCPTSVIAYILCDSSGRLGVEEIKKIVENLIA